MCVWIKDLRLFYGLKSGEHIPGIICLHSFGRKKYTLSLAKINKQDPYGPQNLGAFNETLTFANI